MEQDFENDFEKNSFQFTCFDSALQTRNVPTIIDPEIPNRSQLRKKSSRTHCYSMICTRQARDRLMVTIIRSSANRDAKFNAKFNKTTYQYR